MSSSSPIDQNRTAFPRLKRGPDDKENADRYIVNASEHIVLEAAAEAWSAGVPWEEAYDIASRAVDKVNKIARPFVKAKAKPKAKGRAR